MSQDWQPPSFTNPEESEQQPAQPQPPQPQFRPAPYQQQAPLGQPVQPQPIQPPQYYDPRMTSPRLPTAQIPVAWVVIGVMALVLAFFAYQTMSGDKGEPREEPKKEIVEPIESDEIQTTGIWFKRDRAFASMRGEVYLAAAERMDSFADGQALIKWVNDEINKAGGPRAQAKKPITETLTPIIAGEWDDARIKQARELYERLGRESKW